MLSENKYLLGSKLITILFSYCLSASVILNSGYLLLVTKDSKIAYFTIPVAAICTVIMMFDYKKLKVGFLEIFLLCISLVLFISLVLNNESINSYIGFMSILITAYFISKYYRLETFSKSYINIILGIVIISFIFNFTISRFGVPGWTGTVYTTASDVPFYNLYLYFTPKLTNASQIFRNQGVFWEPGLFASHIIIAMALEICFSEKMSKRVLFLLFCGVISTLSTAGIMLLVFIYILYIDRKTEGKNRVIWFFLLTCLFFFGWINVQEIISTLQYISMPLFSKLTSGEITTVTRLNGPLLNLKLFVEEPLIGYGINGANNRFIQEMFEYGVDSQTSTTTFILSAFGIIGSIYTVLWVFAIKNISRLNSVKKIVLFILLFIIINKEPHISIMSTWCILFVLLKNKNQNNMDDNNEI